MIRVLLLLFRRPVRAGLGVPAIDRRCAKINFFPGLRRSFRLSVGLAVGMPRN